MTDRSPCVTVPAAELPAGARFLCLAALVLMQLLAWADRRRRCR